MRAFVAAAAVVSLADVVSAGSIRGAEPADDVFCTPTVERDFTCAWSWMKRLQSEVPTTVCNIAKMLQDVNSKRAELHEDVDEFLGQFAEGASGILASSEITNLKDLKTAEAATKTAMSDVVKMHTVGEPDAQSEAVADEDVADAETKVEDSDSNDGAKNSGSAGGGDRGSNSGSSNSEKADASGSDDGMATAETSLLQLGKLEQRESRKGDREVSGSGSASGSGTSSSSSTSSNTRSFSSGSSSGPSSGSNSGSNSGSSSGSGASAGSGSGSAQSPITAMLMKPISDEIHLIKQVLKSTRSNALKKVEDMEIHGSEVIADAAKRAYEATATATDKAKFYVNSEMDRALATVGRATEDMRVALEEHSITVGDDISRMRKDMDALMDETIERANAQGGILEAMHEKTRGLKSRVHQLEYEGHNDHLDGLVNPVVTDLKNVRDSITTHDENMKGVQMEDNDPQASPVCLRKLWLFLETADGGGMMTRLREDDHYLALVGAAEVGKASRTGLLDKVITFLNPSNAPMEAGTDKEAEITRKVAEKNLNMVDLVVHYIEDIQDRSEKYVHESLPKLREFADHQIVEVLEAFEADMSKMKADIEKVHADMEKHIRELTADTQSAIDKARQDAEDKLKATRDEADGIVGGQGKSSRDHFKTAGQTFLDRINIIKSMIAGNVANTEKWVQETFDEKNPYTVKMEDAVVVGSNKVQSMNSAGIVGIRKVITETAFLSEGQTARVGVKASIAAMVGHVSDKFRDLVKVFEARMAGKIAAHYQSEAMGKMMALRKIIVDEIKMTVVPNSGASSPISQELEALWKEVAIVGKQVDGMTVDLTKLLSATHVCAPGDATPPISFHELCTITV